MRWMPLESPQRSVDHGDAPMPHLGQVAHLFLGAIQIVDPHRVRLERLDEPVEHDEFRVIRRELHDRFLGRMHEAGHDPSDAIAQKLVDRLAFLFFILIGVSHDDDEAIFIAYGFKPLEQFVEKRVPEV